MPGPIKARGRKHARPDEQLCCQGARSYSSARTPITCVDQRRAVLLSDPTFSDHMLATEPALSAILSRSRPGSRGSCEQSRDRFLRPPALPSQSISNGNAAEMKKMRNHIRMTTSLEEQLAELVRKYVQLADELEDSPEQKDLLSKARKIGAAIGVARISSPKLAPK